MQGQQQEQQPHPPTLAPAERRGAETSFARTHQHRFPAARPLPAGTLLLPPRRRQAARAPSTHPQAKCGEAGGLHLPTRWDATPSGMEPGSQSHPTGRRHKLSASRLGQSGGRRGGSPPTRGRAQCGERGSVFLKEKQTRSPSQPRGALEWPRQAPSSPL